MDRLLPLFLILLSGCTDICGSEVLETEISPNRKLKAVSYLYDCGATTSFSTQVSILENEEEINSSGNTFITKGKNNLELNWLSNESLQITHAKKLDIYKQEKILGNIHVSYN